MSLLVDVRPIACFCHESLQNDICCFRTMTIAVTLSFKLVVSNIYLSLVHNHMAYYNMLFRHSLKTFLFTQMTHAAH